MRCYLLLFSAVLLCACEQESAVEIAGTIFVEQATRVDSDVKGAAQRSNNTLSDAQPLPNPVRLGGFVEAQVDSGAGDPVDVYRLDLFQGQQIQLQVAQEYLSATGPGDVTLQNILSLEILSQDSAVLSHGEAGYGQPLTLQVEPAIAAQGQCFLRVQAVSGASNYILSISGSIHNNELLAQTPAPLVLASPASLYPASSATTITPGAVPETADDFVPGELIVDFKPTLKSTVLSRIKSLGIKGRFDGKRHSGRLLRFEAEHAQRILSDLGANRGDDSASLATRLSYKQETLDVLAALRRHPDVAAVRLNYVHRPATLPSDPGYQSQWYLEQLNMPVLWDMALNTPASEKDVIVAVIDTGVVSSHPDLQGRLVPGYDFVRNRVNGENNELDGPFGLGDGIDVNAEEPLGAPVHGTMVAGVIAARANNGAFTAGMAWERVKIMPIRALGPFGGTDYEIEQAVRYAAGLDNDSGMLPERPADIINLSISGNLSSSPDRLPPAFEQAIERGLIIVAAAGNNGNNTQTYPAVFEPVISVGAVDAALQRAPYSNVGQHLDLMAFGGDTRDLTGDGEPDGIFTLTASTVGQQWVYGNRYATGTSVAAPQVSATLALMKLAYPGLTPDLVRGLIKSGALSDDLGIPGFDGYFGYGVINPVKALKAVGAAGARPALSLLAEPAQLNFTVRRKLSLHLSQAGLGRLTIDDIRNTEPWLHIKALSVDSETRLGQYQVEFIPELLPESAITHLGAIQVQWSDATDPDQGFTQFINVLVQHPGISLSNNAGDHKVYLIDTETNAVVDSQTVSAHGGVYLYRFTGVDPGSYRVYASSDLDADAAMYDSGEAWGQYPPPGSGSKIQVSGQSGLGNRGVYSGVSEGSFNFSTGFSYSLGLVPAGDGQAP